MWQTPNAKGGKGGKRSGGRYRRPMHIRRLDAELRSVTPGNPVEARLVVNDLSMDGIGLFCAQAVAVGLDVTLTIAESTPIHVHGKVVYCQPADTHMHVLSTHSFNYRVGVQFQFSNEEEKKAFQTYLEQSMHELVPSAA
jgi:hypothetical protein